MTVLAELDGEKLKSAREASVAAPGFAEVLARALGRRTEAPKSEAPAGRFRGAGVTAGVGARMARMAGPGGAAGAGAGAGRPRRRTDTTAGWPRGRWS